MDPIITAIAVGLFLIVAAYFLNKWLDIIDWNKVFLALGIKTKPRVIDPLKRSGHWVGNAQNSGEIPKQHYHWRDIDKEQETVASGNLKTYWHHIEKDNTVQKVISLREDQILMCK